MHACFFVNLNHFLNIHFPELFLNVILLLFYKQATHTHSLTHTHTHTHTHTKNTTQKTYNTKHALCFLSLCAIHLSLLFGHATARSSRLLQLRHATCVCVCVCVCVWGCVCVCVCVCVWNVRHFAKVMLQTNSFCSPENKLAREGGPPAAALPVTKIRRKKKKRSSFSFLELY